MSTTKKRRALEAEKSRLREKLLSIDSQKQTIFTYLEELTQKASDIAAPILEETSMTRFSRQFTEVNRQLEDCLNKLFLIRTSLPGEGESEDETSDEDPNTVSGPSKMAATSTVPSSVEVAHCNTNVVSETHPRVAATYVKASAGEPPARGESEGLLHVSLDQAPLVSSTCRGTVGDSSAFPDSAAGVAKPGAGKPGAVSTAAASEIASLELPPPPCESASAQMPADAASVPCVRKRAESSSSAVSIASHCSLSSYGFGPHVTRIPVQAGDRLVVKITHCVSPSLFWVQMFTNDLSALMEQLCLHYSRVGARGGVTGVPQVGLVCCARFTQDDTWYRARVVAVYPRAPPPPRVPTAGADAGSFQEYEVDVVYIDYGNEERLPLSRLRPLEKQFAQLPQQALCCSLAKVCPPANALLWTDAQRAFFDRVVRGHRLLAALHGSATYDALAVDMFIISNEDLRVDVAKALIVTHNAELIEDLKVAPSSQSAQAEAAAVTNLKTLAVAGSHGPSPVLASARAPSVVSSSASFTSPQTSPSPRGGATCSEHEPSTDANQAGKAGRLSGVASNTGERTALGDAATRTTTGKASKNNNSAKRLPHQSANRKIPLLPTGLSSSSCGSRSLSSMSTEGESATKDEGKVSQEKKGGGGPERGEKEAVKPGDRGQEMGKPGEQTKERTEVSLLREENAERAPAQRASDAERPSIAAATVKVQGNDGSFRCMVAHIVSPSNFFVHQLESGAAIDALHDGITAYYESLKSGAKPPPRLEVGDICCVKHNQDGSWYRARVLATSAGHVKVHYVDWGDEETVATAMQVLPLEPRFREPPAFAVRCSLSDLRPARLVVDYVNPAEKKAEEGRGWSQEAVRSLKSYTGVDKPLTAYIIPGDGDDDCKQVCLCDTADGGDIWINEELIRLGHAAAHAAAHSQPDVVRVTRMALEKATREAKADGTRADGSSSPGNAMMRNWNPLEADYLGDHNSYHVDVTDAQVAVQGYKPDHEGQVCKFFARGDKCFRAENCPYEHVAGGEDLAPPDRSEVLCYARDLRCAAPGAWLAADVSAIYNPQHFYVVLPFGSHPVDRLRNDVALQRRLELEENLDSLMTDMNEHYSRAVYRDRPLVSLALGEIVAALHMADETWCRARVVDTNDDDCTVEVLYIDYGNMEWLPERRVRMLLSRFTRLPFQAVECFLEGIEPPGGDGAGWNEDATRVAEDLVDGRTLTAKVVSWEENGMLHAELYYIDSDCPTNIVDIGAALVESGVARYVSSPQSLNNTMH